jgi:hypothetical protein
MRCADWRDPACGRGGVATVATDLAGRMLLGVCERERESERMGPGMGMQGLSPLTSVGPLPTDRSYGNFHGQTTGRWKLS